MPEIKTPLLALKEGEPFTPGPDHSRLLWTVDLAHIKLLEALENLRLACPEDAELRTAVVAKGLMARFNPGPYDPPNSFDAHSPELKMMRFGRSITKPS